MITCILLIMTWCVVSFMDLIFKTCLFFPYLNTLNKTGLDVSPFKVSWSSSRIPRGLLNSVQKRPKLYQIWFDIGALLACIFFIPSIIFYFYSMSKVSIFDNASNNSTTAILVPMIPGYTFPASDWIILFFVAIFCSIFHECGHAVAAKRERVNVESYGFGVLVVFPWAFTTLNCEQLMSLSDWQKLRIYAAGVWHNVVLSITAAVLLISGPYLLSPIYSYGQGVTVLRAENIISGSAGGLRAGDQIFAINDCLVTDITSWEKCLALISMNKQRGYCVPKSFISHKNIAEKGSKHDCCGANTVRHVCFQYSDEMIEKEACLPGRDVIVNSHFCDFNSNCEKQSFCLVPLSSKVSDRFLQIHRNRNNSVLFVGSVEELRAYVKVTNAIARSKLLPVTFADVLETFLIYTLYFSSGYACLNLLPCPFFDGETISEIIFYKIICYIFPGFNLGPRKLLKCIRRFHMMFAISMFLALIPNLSHYLNFLT